MLRIHSEDAEFSYKQPKMEYDKETGDVKIIEEKKKSKKIIRSTDDVERERQAVLKEVGLETMDVSKMDVSTTEKQREAAGKLSAAMNKFQTEYDVDPTQVYVFGRDMTRIDVGLII